MSTTKKRTTKAILEERLLRLRIERESVDIEDARFTPAKRRELADQLAGILPVVVQHYMDTTKTRPGALPIELVMFAMSLTPIQKEKLAEVLDAEQFATLKRILLDDIPDTMTPN